MRSLYVSNEEKMAMTVLSVYKDQIAECIFRNAITSIQLGVEDYEMARAKTEIGRRRIISAVRNLYAGVLLLLKSYLANVSCDTEYSLLRKKVVPTLKDSKIVWIGKGKTTIDFEDIKDVFNSINIEIEVQRLQSLRAYRNDIEHYFDSDNLNFVAVESMLADTFILCSEFMLSHLKLSRERIEEILTPSVLKVLVQSKCVLKKARYEQTKAFLSLTWFDGALEALKKAICPYCSTPVLLLDETSASNQAHDATFKCRGCFKSFDYETVVTSFASMVNEELASVLPGAYGEPPLFFMCSQCGQETFNLKSKACINCGYHNMLECSFCGKDIEDWELEVYYETGRCSSCDHKLGRDD